MARQRRTFTEEFKREAVNLVKQSGEKPSTVARDLGIDGNVLARWCREAEPSAESDANAKYSIEEFERMRRELAKVKTERDILKKGARLLRSGPQVKYGFIAKHRAIWPTRTMCRVLGVSTSGFYDWFERPPSERQRENERLLKIIRASHEASDRTYGSPRIFRDLREAGEACSENRIARIMQRAGLKARNRRRRMPGQAQEQVHSIAPNLLDRRFDANGPNQKWVADFTYVWTTEGRLFVAVVIDLFSRRVVGWSM